MRLLQPCTPYPLHCSRHTEAPRLCKPALKMSQVTFALAFFLGMFLQTLLVGTSSRMLLDTGPAELYIL